MMMSKTYCQQVTLPIKFKWKNTPVIHIYMWMTRESWQHVFKNVYDDNYYKVTRVISETMTRLFSYVKQLWSIESAT